MSSFAKTLSHVQPLLIHLMHFWGQPLPFPTLFKIMYSGCIVILIFLTIITPFIIIISYYDAVQYLLER